jgi:hypothetical protein
MSTTRRRRIAAVVLNCIILVQVFGLGMLTHRQSQAGWPWDKNKTSVSPWDVSVGELSERLGSLGFTCLLHGEQPIADLGLVSAKCDVGTKRFDLAVYDSEQIAIESVHMSTSPMGCMLARLRGARHLAIAAGETWSVFTTSLEDARLIATELNGYLVLRECRSTSRA